MKKPRYIPLSKKCMKFKNKWEADLFYSNPCEWLNWEIYTRRMELYMTIKRK